MSREKLIAIDFDGVLHSFSSGWQGGRTISDPPVPGAIYWLICLVVHPDIKIVIYSARNFRWGGKKAMKKWLLKYGFYKHLLCRLSFPILKPPSDLLIDDRVFCFKDKFPTIPELLSFEPWHKKSIWGEDDNK